MKKTRVDHLKQQIKLDTFYQGFLFLHMNIRDKRGRRRRRREEKKTSSIIYCTRQREKKEKKNERQRIYMGFY